MKAACARPVSDLSSHDLQILRTAAIEAVSRQQHVAAIERPSDVVGARGV